MKRESEAVEQEAVMSTPCVLTNVLAARNGEVEVPPHGQGGWLLGTQAPQHSPTWP